MALQGRFISSVVPWFRDRPQVVTQVIQDTFNSHKPGADIGWRAIAVTDYRERFVPAAAKRLVRWDMKAPNQVFASGFPPPFQPPKDDIPSHAADLSGYVLDYSQFPDTIFVSTARYYRNSQGLVTRWVPRNHRSRFEYEVFAYGGIDVNLSLGDHRFFSQHEITFPGGIRPEFIRSARYYDANGIPRELIMNSLFNPAANPNNEEIPGVTDADLPAPVRTLDVRWWTPDKPWNPPPGLQDVDDLVGGDEVMREPGDQEEAPPDEDSNWLPRASILVPGKADTGYFFSGTRYVEIYLQDTTGSIVPGGGPHTIVSKWAALDQAGFDAVDAALPRSDYAGEIYFFRNTEYVLVDAKGGPEKSKILKGPTTITDDWSPLKKAGFNTVDTVFLGLNKERAYIFRGKQYIEIDVSGGKTGGNLIDGPKDIIPNNWPALDAAKFSTVDSILRIHDQSEAVYFFSGPSYALIWCNPSRPTDNKLLDGPKLVGVEWPSLSRGKAGFY